MVGQTMIKMEMDTIVMRIPDWIVMMTMQASLIAVPYMSSHTYIHNLCSKWTVAHRYPIVCRILHNMGSNNDYLSMDLLVYSYWMFRRPRHIKLRYTGQHRAQSEYIPRFGSLYQWAQWYKVILQILVGPQDQSVGTCWWWWGFVDSDNAQSWWWRKLLSRRRHHTWFYGYRWQKQYMCRRLQWKRWRILWWLYAVAVVDFW